MATLADYYSRINRNMVDDVERFNLDNFVETGTGLGDSVSYALNNGFGVKNVHSIEIHSDIASKARTRFFSYKNCNIVNADSFDGLKTILPMLAGNTLFFLDAHFPGADFGYTNYTSDNNKNLNLPLEKELELIVNSRDITHDVFLIDDLRIYEEANYEMGNWPKEKGASHSGIDFIVQKLEKTHTIEKHFFYSGFLTIMPKQ